VGHLSYDSFRKIEERLGPQELRHRDGAQPQIPRFYVTRVLWALKHMMHSALPVYSMGKSGPIPNIVLCRVLQKTYKKCITIFLRVLLVFLGSCSSSSVIAGAGMPMTRFAPFASMDLHTNVVWISLEAAAALVSRIAMRLFFQCGQSTSGGPN